MKKKVSKAKCIFTILAIIYILITILAIVSLIFEQLNTNGAEAISTGKRIGIIFKEIWWPLVIILMLVIAYILYGKKDIKKIRLAGAIELLIGASMLINTLINISSYGVKNFTIIFSFIFPLLFILFSLQIVTLKDKIIEKNESKNNYKIKSTI